MSPPYPPQGQQQPYTERPLRVYGEQYVVEGQLPVGALTPDQNPVPMTEPHVITPAGLHVIHLTDWVITNRYTGQVIEVISDEEFTERFGGGGPP